MPFFTHNHARLFYTDQGSPTARPILLLHGWTCDSHDWSFQIPTLLDHGLRVVALDLRGHGASNAPDYPGVYTFETMVDDFLAAVRHLNLDKVIVMAHSMSTVLSSIFTVQHPELVRALILVHPIYGMEAPQRMSAFYEKWRDSPAEVPQATADIFQKIMYTTTTPPWIRTWTYRRVLATPGHAIVGCIESNGPTTGNILGTTDECKKYMQRRVCPRLAIRSSKEALGWEEQIGLSEQSEACLLEEGTFLQLVAPEKVNGIVVSWLKKHKFVHTEVDDAREASTK